MIGTDTSIGIGVFGGNKSANSSDQNNFARIINVNEAQLEEGPDLKSRIAAYINTLNHVKADTDTEIWVEYSDSQANLTPFLASNSLAYGCSNPDLSPYNLQLYHDGEGAYPVVGDTVFNDALGTSRHANFSDRQMGNLEYLQTDSLGIQIFACK